MKNKDIEADFSKKADMIQATPDARNKKGPLEGPVLLWRTREDSNPQPPDP